MPYNPQAPATQAQVKQLKDLLARNNAMTSYLLDFLLTWAARSENIEMEKAVRDMTNRIDEDVKLILAKNNDRFPDLQEGQ